MFKVANDHGGEKPQPESQDLYIHMEMKQTDRSAINPQIIPRKTIERV